MSIPAKEQVSRFLAPLRGTFTILLLHETQARIQLSKFLLKCTTSQSTASAILDTDAFYCANLGALARDFEHKSDFLLPPEQDFDATSLLPLVSLKVEFLIIDDFNSIYSLASDNTLSHKLRILVRLLSHNARSNRSWIIATAFKSELASRFGSINKRTLASLGDLLVDVEIRDGSLKFSSGCEGIWPGGELNL